MTFDPTSPDTTVPRSSSPSAVGTGLNSPSLAHASLTGVAKGRVRLSFTLTTRKHAPTLRTITITLPAGLAFPTSKKSLAQGIFVKQGTKKLKFAAKVSHGEAHHHAEATGVQRSGDDLKSCHHRLEHTCQQGEEREGKDAAGGRRVDEHPARDNPDDGEAQSVITNGRV